MTDTPSPKLWQDFFYTTQDGLRLGGRKYGWENLDNGALVCLPGLTRNSADYHELAVHLATRDRQPRRVLCLDYRGRGVSEYDKNWENYNPLKEAEDVLAGVMAAGLEHFSILGTSRGGLIAMILVVMRPGIFNSVILHDVGPEIDGQGILRIRQYMKHSKAPRNWDEAINILQTTGASSFPDRDRLAWEKEARLIYVDRDGRPELNYDPKLANTLDAIDFDKPLSTMWEQYAGFAGMPVMAIRGELSDVLSAEIFARMKQEIPHLKQVAIPRQGHVPDLATADLPLTISAFLRSVDQKRASS